MDMKKSIKIILSIIISVAVVVAGIFGIIAIQRKNIVEKGDYSAVNGASDRVVLFIGDGMGYNHIKTASAYLERDIFFDKFEQSGYVSTFSLNMIGSTDSAAAATALATGTKVDNGEVAYHGGKDIKSISEYAKEKGYSVGIVTTDSLAGATPAGFSAHATGRGETKEIVTTQLSSNIDLFLGAGASTYNGYKADWEAKGYKFTNKYSELDMANDKIIGAFDNISNYTGDDEHPTLPQLVDFAVDYMEAKHGDKYFLMVEGAHIDKMSHKNKMKEMIEYLDEFDNTIRLVHNKMQSVDNYSLIVTADHETGGLKYSGQTKAEIDNSMFTRGGHSSADVRYYIDWKLNTTKNIEGLVPNKIDNTSIFKICYALLCG